LKLLDSVQVLLMAIKHMEVEMSTTASRIVVCGLLFLFTLISGVWLSHSGRPLNTAIFTIHKLVALATVIVIGINIYKLSRTVDVQTVVLAAIAVTGVLFLAMFVSGALLSFEKSMPQAVLRVHQVVPLLAVVTSSTAIYLLISNKT
jgi:hypothetical protein